MPGPRTHAAPALVVLAVSLVLTALTTYGVWRYYQARFDARLDAAMADVRDRIEERLATYVQTLRGVRAHLHAVPRVTRQEFAAYAKLLNLQRNYPGILGIGFAMAVTEGGVSALEAELAGDAATPFQVWPAGRRAQYAPIVYIEPFDVVNRRAYGFDMWSEPVRRAALRQAADTGEPVLSGRLTLVQDASVTRPEPGFLLVLPVYKHGRRTFASVAERRDAVVGFVYSPFRAGEFFARVLEREGMSVHVEIIANGARLFSDDAGGDRAPWGLRKATVTLWGQPWTIVVVPARYGGLRRITVPLGVVIIGFGLSFVLFRLTQTQTRHRLVAESLLDNLRRSQEALERSHRQTSGILESISEAFLSTGPEGQLHYANRQAGVLFGAAPEALLGRPIADLFPDAADLRAAIARVLEAGVPVEIEGVLGGRRCVELHGYPSPGGAAFYVRDVTRRKRDERALEESEQRFKSLFLYNPDPVFSISLEGRFTDFNPAAERISGFAAASVVGTSFIDMIVPPHVDATVAQMRRAAAGEPVAFETTVRGAGGQHIDVLVMAGPVVVGGKIQGVFGVAKDVTEARAAERRLAESEERYRLVIEGSYDGVWDWDLRTGAVFWSDRLLDILGLDRAAYERDQPTLESILHPDDRERAARLKESHFTKGTEYRAEFRLRHASGAYRTCLVRGKAQRAADGAPIRMAGTVTDITDRKRFESTLAFLADASVNLSATLEPAGVLQTLVRQAVPFLGDGAAVYLREASGEVYAEAAAPADSVAADLRRVVGAGVDGLTARRGRLGMLGAVTFQPVDERLPDLLRFDARAREAWARLHPRAALVAPLVVRGQTLGVVAFAALTQRRVYGSAELAVAEELARRAAVAFENAVLYRGTRAAVRARDEFLSVASHELKTPVTSIHLQIQLLLEILHRQGMAALPAGRLEQALENTDRQVSRLVRLMNDLLDVSRLSTGNLRLEREPVDLRALVEEVTARLRPSSPAPLRIVGTARVDGRWDRLRLEQVVTNLVANAIKYGAGRPVTISVTAEEGRVRLSVSDEGIGVAPEDLERIFNRFERAVSEKQFGGLGMGLYIVKQIVEAHGGEIHVVSRVGKGSTFVVELPRGPLANQGGDA